MPNSSQPMGGLIGPLRDANRLVELIVRFTEEQPGEVRRRLQCEYAAMGSSVRMALKERSIAPYRWSESMERFYEETDAFLYESIVWNLTHAKCEMRIWIGNYLNQVGSPQSILTFGDGLGFDSMYLSNEGHDVTYFEVSRHCSQFASAIFEDANLDINVVSDSAELAGEKFDTIVCLDVLEHVSDPVSLVQWLQTMLRPSGRLIVSAPFFLVNDTVQTHLSSNRRFSGDYKELYQQQGLHPVAGRLFHNPLVLQQGSHNGVPVKIRLGSLILKAGRYWGLPFNVSNSAIVRAKFPLSFENFNATERNRKQHQERSSIRQKRSEARS